MGLCRFILPLYFHLWPAKVLGHWNHHQSLLHFWSLFFLISVYPFQIFGQNCIYCVKLILATLEVILCAMLLSFITKLCISWLFSSSFPNFLMLRFGFFINLLISFKKSVKTTGSGTVEAWLVHLFILLHLL